MRERPRGRGTRSRTDRSKKRPAGELDELAIEAARLLYERGLSAVDAVRALRQAGHEVRSERDVRRLAARARDQRNPLVRVRVERTDEPLPEQLEDLGVALARTAGLRSVLLIPSELSSEKNYDVGDPEERRRAAEASDRLHNRLGRLAAQYVWWRVRDGDCLAVGGGRATAATVERLERTVPAGCRLGRVQVVSLAARFGEKEWAAGDTGTRKMDADDLLDPLGRSLAREFESRPVVLALASQPKREVTEDVVARLAPQLAAATWSKRPPRPDLALFGVSVVHALHPLLAPTAFTQALGPIVEDLRRELDRGRTGAFLADVCNHYWAIGDRAAANFDALRAIARRLNEECIAIPPAKLDQAGDKLLVAGGAQKYPAILDLLQGGDNPLRPTTLVTDDAIAKRLLRDLGGSPTPPGEQW